MAEWSSNGLKGAGSFGRWLRSMGSGAFTRTPWHSAVTATSTDPLPAAARASGVRRSRRRRGLAPLRSWPCWTATPPRAAPSSTRPATSSARTLRAARAASERCSSWKRGAGARRRWPRSTRPTAPHPASSRSTPPATFTASPPGAVRATPAPSSSCRRGVSPLPRSRPSPAAGSCAPNQPLAIDAAGNLYGLNGATLFEVARGSGVVTSLVTLPIASGDLIPTSLAADAAGDIYGALVPSGQASDVDTSIFEVARGGGATTLATFVGTSGSGPANFTIDAAGNLYGTTSAGGAADDGTVFAVVKGSGVVTTLVSFDGANGRTPAGLVRVARRHLVRHHNLRRTRRRRNPVPGERGGLRNSRVDFRTRRYLAVGHGIGDGDLHRRRGRQPRLDHCGKPDPHRPRRPVARRDRRGPQPRRRHPRERHRHLHRRRPGRPVVGRRQRRLHRAAELRGARHPGNTSASASASFVVNLPPANADARFDSAPPSASTSP